MGDLTFKAAFQAKAKEVRDAKASEPGNKKKKGPSGIAVPVLPPVKALPAEMDAMMDHFMAKPYTPPVSFLRKSRADITWHGRVSVLPTINRSVRRHGPHALRLVISGLWRDWCLIEGIEAADRPMKDLSPVE